MKNELESIEIAHYKRSRALLYVAFSVFIFCVGFFYFLEFEQKTVSLITTIR